MEGDGVHQKIHNHIIGFQSTPSAWRETLKPPMFINFVMTFQSTPSAWRETGKVWEWLVNTIAFQSTPSAWRETVSQIPKSDTPKYFNPLPPHGGRRTSGTIDDRIPISIHSLRMEGDSSVLYSRSPNLEFQSTPSAWRETQRV